MSNVRRQIQMRDAEQFQRENDAVLALVQAMLGAISPNIRAVSVRCDGEVRHLHFELEREDARDREEIADIATNFEILYDRPVPMEVHVKVNAEPWPNGVASVEGRAVYVRQAM